MNISYIYDPQILSYIDSLSIKILYLKATLLNNNDIPIQSLEGQLTSGNMTLNGTSSVRRQGSVSFIIDPLKKLDEQYLKNLFFLNKRISLEVGFDNTGNQYIEEYRQFWFKLGTFIITQPSISKNINNGISISLTLNDKMSLLNGTAGGLIPTSVVHSPMYTIDNNGELKAEYPLIYDMIKTFVHEAGEIPLNQIIIGDVERQIRNQVWWASHDTPIYYNKTMGKFSTISTSLDSDSLENEYTYGQNIGYKWVALTYPTDKEFVSNAGEAITSLLDKVKNVLGNYEYFFDMDGNFRFQMIKNYLNQGSEIDDLTDALADKYFNNLSDVKSVYTFENDNRHTTISNNPVYKDIKNDIVVYGKHGKTEQIIRYHLLIMNKPSIGNTYYVDKYIDDEGFIRARGVYLTQETDKYVKVVTWDWRQELYLRNKLNKIKNFLAYEVDMEVPKMLNILNSAKDDNDQPISHSLYYQGLEHQLSYYIDILDPNDFSGDLKNQLQAISIDNIGLKSTTITDDTVNCVFTTKVPDVDITDEVISSNLQKYVQVGVTANPAFEVARTALHTYLGYNSSISIQTVPIYHLEPNSRITVKDNDTGINGDYIITSLTIPLGGNGMMSINATRALERI